jgi:hypothetical protein
MSAGLAMVMGTIERFPLGRPENSTPNWFSAAFALCMVILSVGTGLLASGTYAGRIEATVTNQGIMFQQQQAETSRHIEALSQAISTLATSQAALQAQMTALHDALVQERTDRLNDQHLYQRR